jgi:hypothetical protein
MGMYVESWTNDACSNFEVTKGKRVLFGCKIFELDYWAVYKSKWLV